MRQNQGFWTNNLQLSNSLTFQTNFHKIPGASSSLILQKIAFHQYYCNNLHFMQPRHLPCTTVPFLPSFFIQKTMFTLNFSILTFPAVQTLRNAQSLNFSLTNFDIPELSRLRYFQIPDIPGYSEKREPYTIWSLPPTSVINIPLNTLWGTFNIPWLLKHPLPHHAFRDISTLVYMMVAKSE